MTHQCTECGFTDFETRIEADEFQRHVQAFVADVEYSVCRQCGNEVIFAEQIKRNDCRMRDAWRKIDGLLTAQEIIELRNKLGLTQQDAAKLFGGGVNAFSKYERSEVMQSLAMDKLLRCSLEFPAVYTWLKQEAGLNEGINHQDIFGHLDTAELTANDAADYLEISIATFRRYIKSQKITASKVIGSTHLYSLASLREFKNALNLAKHA
jgi:HTH-type transcriptional regulator/antitoxin MqsA